MSEDWSDKYPDRPHPSDLAERLNAPNKPLLMPCEKWCTGKPNPAPAPAPVTPQRIREIVTDCIDTLVGLGVSKTLAESPKPNGAIQASPFFPLTRVDCGTGHLEAPGGGMCAGGVAPKNSSNPRRKELIDFGFSIFT